MHLSADGMWRIVKPGAKIKFALNGTLATPRHGGDGGQALAPFVQNYYALPFGWHKMATGAHF